MPYPITRELGDDLCLDCPKWDAEKGAPRPSLGVRDMALVALLEDVKASGALPNAGGVLDQDPELLADLATIRGSSWWRELNGSE